MFVLLYIKPLALSINVDENVGALTFFCFLKLHDGSINKTNYFVYIIAFSKFSHHLKFVNGVTDFSQVIKFII